MQWIRTLSLLGSLLAATRLHAESAPVIECEGVYPGHLQGVCSDGRDSIFWSFTTTLVKTDRSGRLQERVDVASHHGDLDFHNGKLYVAVNLGKFNDPLGNADSWMYVYDADDLALVEKHRLPEVFHGAGGVAYHDGRFLVVGGSPPDAIGNTLYVYDLNYRFLGRRALSGGPTHLGIQTAAFADGSWWFGCYGRPRTGETPATPPILLRADDAMAHVERFEFDAALGLLPERDGGFLTARGTFRREVGHGARLVPTVRDSAKGLRLLEIDEASP